MEQLTQNELKQNIIYCSDTGIFTRLSGKEISNKPNSKGYLRVMVNKKHYLAHRLAWFCVYGYFPKYIDHIDGNRINNKLSNLRSVTCEENQQNLSIACNNTSGVTGISYSKSRGKWEAKIQIKGKTIHLGRYLEKEDAIKARKDGESKYNFHENHGKAKTH